MSHFFLFPDDFELRKPVIQKTRFHQKTVYLNTLALPLGFNVIHADREVNLQHVVFFEPRPTRAVPIAKSPRLTWEFLQ